ncbi:bifunctional 2-polyprenyl-6-hydroxyphenol methylase/3-demethylubiquinol 3-O-methyltransferase UbiG [Stappia sp. TSB10GB4]|uniref:class I SAM-dependent methyltransferase n=1 Tax=Stappia sp. TSB10GB4 TaxID=2003584 RepID=UPI00164407DD|nr:class I SAM-dependent methyltransferase [Stappia sp. TSB10GB4]
MEREDWNRRYDTSEFIWTLEPNAWVAGEAAGLLPGRALDLAAGEGRNALWLAGRGWKVHAVDFSDVALAKAEAAAAHHGVGEHVRFESADLRQFEPHSGAYDLVLIAYLQIPQFELGPILQRAATATAPGGTLLLVGHDTSNLTHGSGGPRDPAVLYSADDVTAALDGGLLIETAGTVERHAHGGTAIDCVVRARRATSAEAAA